MKRTRTSVGRAALSAASVAAMAAAAAVLAGPVAADPAKPVEPPKNKAGELVIGSGNLPDGVSYGGAVLSGASAGWNAVWAGLGKARVDPAECKALYTGFPIPKGTDTAQTNGSIRGTTWSMVVSKFAVDLAPQRAALPKCGTFKATTGDIVSEISVRTIAVTGAPDGLGLEFTQKSKRGNVVEYRTSRQYTAVVNGVTLSLRGGKESREPSPYIGADDQVAVDLLTTQIAIIKKPPEAAAVAPAPASAAPSGKPGAPAAKPGAPAPSAKPGAPAPAAKPGAPAKPAPSSAAKPAAR